MTQTSDVLCAALAHNYIINMASHEKTLFGSLIEATTTQILNERKTFTTDLMRIKQDLLRRADTIVEPNRTSCKTSMSMALLTHHMMESRIRTTFAHFDVLYEKLSDLLEEFKVGSRKRLKVQRKIETRVAKCVGDLGQVDLDGSRLCDIYKFIDILENSFMELYDDIAEYAEETKCARSLKKTLCQFFRRS